MSPGKKEITEWFKNLQSEICEQVEACDGKVKFHSDLWDRPGGGGGITKVIDNGSIIEKGGVNYAEVHGTLNERIGKILQSGENEFYATGVSIVMHPNNPFVPIIHMNVRYFEFESGTCWFGGGIDLTPHYINTVDARYFHNSLKEICDKHGENYYFSFKKWADDYFYLKHRHETRGIGGIFFDQLKPDSKFSKEDRWAFVQDVGKSFAPLYVELINRNRNSEFTEEQTQWQNFRRGRYVEFNLIHDRGTRFGLETNGRVESILMSMPPSATWNYNLKPEEGSAEAKTSGMLRKDIDWAG